MEFLSFRRILFSTTAIFLIAYEISSQEKTFIANTKPLMAMRGTSSKITKQRILRLTEEKEWLALWLEHMTGSKDDVIPEFDFDKIMVIGIFDPQLDNSNGFSADSITEDRKQITIKVNDHSFQSVVPNEIKEAASEARPWGIIVLPKSEKPVILERDVRNHIKDPPKWEKWKTIEGRAVSPKR